jgi:AcrR family transcriptional regulator
LSLTTILLPGWLIDYSHSTGSPTIAPPDRFRDRKLPKQERAALTRQVILTAAAQVFAEHGYRSGTTNRIAERAGVSIGSLYQYFPNKDAILRALMDEHVAAGSRRLDAALGDAPGDIAGLIRVVVQATIDNHRDDPRLHRVLFEEAPRAPEFLERLHTLEAELVALTARMLAAHPEVSVPDAEMSARIVVATIESGVHRLLTGPDAMAPRALEDELVALVVGYLTVPR